ncbi:hypothetical protein GCM10028778_07100 [Barrientosiimonas marina]|uniref:DUF4025 domain-containing protein n=1 Tax=Lentibacillus kimchii TaxID=1542911 RepID=A0ABW2UUT3_9BACI
MKRNKHFRKHVKNIQKETKNTVILNDVAGSPPKKTKQENEELLTPAEKVATHNIDGKTWQDTDK